MHSNDLSQRDTSRVLRQVQNRLRAGAARCHQWAGLLAVAALLAGCDRHADSSEGDHAGHDHTGHNHTPRPAQPAAPKPVASCAHGASRELCFICDPALRDKGRLWCNEHARYEDRCWLCHPELEEKNRAYCAEHSLYEDECFLCHPKLRTNPKPQAAASGALAAEAQTSVLMCGEHGVPEAECGICQSQTAAALQPGQGLKVRLPSAESAELLDIRTGTPEKRTSTDGIECLAEISFNQDKLARVVAPVSGIVQAVEANLGAQVDPGRPVAKLWSAAIAEAVAKAVLTHETLERERKLRAERVTSEQSLQEAVAAHRAACQVARTFGISEEAIDEFGAKPDQPVYLEIRPPFPGEVVERNAVRGALVEAGEALFTVADRTTVWAMLQVPEGQVAEVKTGQSVELRLESQPNRAFRGELTWISPSVDPRTRRVRARAEFANPEGQLRDKMFARARILTGEQRQAVWVPSGAVQIVDSRPFVFVKLADDLFEARLVRVGARSNGQQQILAGLLGSEPVATDRAFALKSQFLLSRLGAGCADD